MAANERKKILFVASECVPFIKTGGLADVVMIPKYSCMKQEVKDQMEYVTHFYMDYHWKSEYVGVLKTVKNGITFYFIDNEGFFTTDKPYTDDPLFEITRFAYFSKACLSALQPIGFRPDLIHCHDWQTGLVPVYLKERFADNEFYQGIKTVMTIHNLKFQGKWNVKDVEDITGLSGYYFTPDKLEAYKDANLLKGGLVYADAITTVSPTYAEEIKTQFYGEGLDGLMNARANDLRGILNGIDYTDFSPDNDKKIFKSYTVDDFRRNKVNAVLSLVLVCLIPLAANFVFVMADPNDVHSLMTYGQVYIFVYFAWVIDRIQFRKVRLQQAVRGVGLALLLLINIMFFRYDNQCYLKAALSQQEAISYFTTMVTQIKSAEGYDDRFSVYVVNDFQNQDETITHYSNLDHVTQHPYGGLSDYLNNYNWKYFVRNWCGFSPDWKNGDELLHLPEVQNMTHYPDDGSIMVIDDKVVIRF